VPWNCLGGNPSQVSGRTHPEVLLVKLAKSFVNLAREYTAVAKAPEGQMEASQAGEEIKKSERFRAYSLHC
jgi:hypothetical protein